MDCKIGKEITYEKEQEREKYPGFLIMFSPTYFMTYEQKVKLKKQKPAIMAKLQAKKLGETCILLTAIINLKRPYKKPY